MTKCELCGSQVKVVGKTTLHYEPISELPRLDEGAVIQVLNDCRVEPSIISYTAKAIVARFSPKVVRLPKKRIIPKSGGSVYLDEAYGYNQALTDCKQSLEEQGLLTKEG